MIFSKDKHFYIYTKPTKPERGQMLVEFMLVLSSGVLIFSFALVILRFCTTLWLHHQTHNLALCLLDGRSEVICRTENTHTLRRLTPWANTSRFLIQRTVDLIHIECEYVWPDWMNFGRFINLMPRVERIHVRLPLYYHRAESLL